MLTYALFPQIGWKFLQNRGNPDAFEPASGKEHPTEAITSVKAETDGGKTYTVKVNGRGYQVEVGPGGVIGQIQPASPVSTAADKAPPKPTSDSIESVRAPMAGHILRISVKEGQSVGSGQVLVVMEAMKMETEVRSRKSGQVLEVCVKVGDAVNGNDVLARVG